jgi:hypothetical protein
MARRPPRLTDKRRPAAIAILALTLVAAGCGSTAPPSPSPLPTASPTPTPAASPSPSLSPSPASSADVDALYDAIEEQVIAIRGLDPERDVARKVIDEAELRAMITEQFDEETPPEYVAANDRLYKALELIPADADLRELTLDLLSGGVAGFYRSDEDTLYIVSRTGLPGVNERITFAHEYDHALQDQNTTVFDDQDGILDQADRILARQAVYEGDATLLMTLWAADNFDLADLAELLGIGNDPEATALLERMPAILRETLLFPYTTGLTFVQSVQAQGGWDAVDGLYDRMPASTEQILHPESYAAREAPVIVDLPDDLATQLGDGWSVPLEDTLGELQLGIWLREGGVDPDDAADAAAGWGGDRLAVIEGPDDTWGVVLETTWDSPTDAAAFLDAVQPVVDGLANPARVSAPAGKGVTILIASDAETLLALDVIFGATGV